jgi:DNA-binding PadR family transcriptional regulator
MREMNVEEAMARMLELGYIKHVKDEDGKPTGIYQVTPEGEANVMVFHVTIECDD